MDPKKKYDYEGQNTLTDTASVVTIYAKTPYDVGGAQLSPKDKHGTKLISGGMSISDYTETAQNAQNGEEPEAFHIHYCMADKFYKAYMINGYDGDTIDIDMEQAEIVTGEDADSLDVEVYAKEKGCKVSISDKRNKKTVSLKNKKKTEGSPFNDFIVYIIKKQTTDAVSLNASAHQNMATGTIAKEYNQNHGLIVICTAATVFLHTPPKIYCSDEATAEEKEALLAQATKVYQSVFYEPIWVERPVCDESYLTYTSTSTIKKLNRLCEFVLGRRNNLGYDGIADVKGRYVILMYENMGDFYAKSKTDEETDKRQEAERQAKFTLSDEFNFANFDSVYSNSGVCMGFARVAAEVYNNGQIQQPRGEIKDAQHFTSLTVDGTLSYDVSQSDSYKTFYDRFLNDYNTSLNPFDEEEDEVIKMLTYYWADGNTRMYSENDWTSFFIDPQKGRYVSWDTIDKATGYIDAHKALICGLSIGNIKSGAHAINLVGYRKYGEATLTRGSQDLKIKEVVVFDTYDSNNPQAIGSLYCYKCELSDSNSIVLYEYMPVAGYEMPDDYRSQFLYRDTDYIVDDEETMIMFCIINEDMESLNVKQWYR